MYYTCCLFLLFSTQVVAHPVVQHFITSRIFDNIPGWRRKGIPYRALLVVVVGLFYPLTTLMNILLPSTYKLSKVAVNPFVRFINGAASFITFLGTFPRSLIRNHLIRAMIVTCWHRLWSNITRLILIIWSPRITYTAGTFWVRFPVSSHWQVPGYPWAPCRLRSLPCLYKKHNIPLGKISPNKLFRPHSNILEAFWGNFMHFWSILRYLPIIDQNFLFFYQKKCS